MGAIRSEYALVTSGDETLEHIVSSRLTCMRQGTQVWDLF